MGNEQNQGTFGIMLMAAYHDANLPAGKFIRWERVLADFCVISKWGLNF
jgi:hypothetical protein